MHSLLLQIKKDVLIRAPLASLQKLGNKTLRVIKKKNKNFEVGLAFVSKSTIKKLNRQYRHKDSVTDVLSFDVGGPPEFIQEKGRQYIGDIIICPDQAKKQAQEFKCSLQKEIERLFVHGLLHLFGYEHKKENEAKKMEKMAMSILEKL